MDPGPLDMSIGILAATFVEFAGKEGDPDTLTKKEMKDLMKKGMPCTLGKIDDAQADQLFNDFDADGDGTVNFSEFITMVAAFTALFHGTISELMQQQS